MLKIGLTGNIGSGKTTVAKIFDILGIPVYHADDEAKKMLTQPLVIDELIHKFSDSILTNQKIDRKKLATLVFSNPISLQFLNNIIHPLLKTDFENWISSLPTDYQYIVQEAAILFESGFDQFVDKTIVITAPVNLRMLRVCNRDQISEEQFLQREDNQWKEYRKLKLTDFVIINDDIQMVIPQVLEIHQNLIKKQK